MNWIILLLAGLFEVSLTFCLGKARAASGLVFYLWGSGFLASTVLSMTLLAKAVQTLPLGTAYAIWTGIGAVGTVLIGIFVLYVLKKKKLKELFTEDLHIANWGRRYAEMELLATEERLISMLSAIASERYKELLEKEPELLQRLPLGNIATYLGITQASLSRIRAQIK
jgi:multidrug transporter EmrE-like cation transporter